MILSDRSVRLLLLGCVFVIATCGLIYELIAGAIASYLLGDSVTQFSTVIGTYLFAMGIGSWLSKFVERGEVTVFVRTQLVLGLIGGASAALLFLIFGSAGSFRVLLYGLITAIGTLVGLEIPLLLRILKDHLEFRDLVSKVLTFDYVGALLASLLFPLVLVPHLGMVRSAFFFGMLNTAVGMASAWAMGTSMRNPRAHQTAGAMVLALLGTGFVLADRLVSWTDHANYVDPVIYTDTTPYQKIVLTRFHDDLRLYLNGNLQFSSRDEYRYHEALVHPALGRVKAPRRVLVLGGGDGLAVREILRHPEVEEVRLVDLDPAMTRLFSTNEMLRKLNAEALVAARVTVENADAFTWLEGHGTRFDCVIIDFPDPSNFALGKLYSTAFFRRVRAVLAQGGVLAVQSTSPYVARQSFWCVERTLMEVGLRARAYHAWVPSFGEWGFILGTVDGDLDGTARLPAGLRFLTAETEHSLFEFPPDMGRVTTDVQRLNNQVLVRYFEAEWAAYVR